MSDNAGGFAVLSNQPVVAKADGMHWGGGAAWILVWVVVIIIILALLALVFCGDFFSSDSSSSDDDKKKKKCDFNLNWLGGLVVFIVVILFLCWLLGAASGRV